MTYAANTSVTIERSKSELERLLSRYGADAFAYMSDESGAVVAFRMKGRHVRFLMPMPEEEDVLYTPSGRIRSNSQAEQALVQMTRSRWRSLVLIVKAKLEAVEAGISTFEREFLSDILLPSGETVHEFLAPQIERAYADGKMPKVLLALTEKT
jgi:hypothetical protein